jgi:hypothetical protein
MAQHGHDYEGDATLGEPCGKARRAEECGPGLRILGVLVLGAILATTVIGTAQAKDAPANIYRLRADACADRPRANLPTVGCGGASESIAVPSTLLASSGATPAELKAPTPARPKWLNPAQFGG